jgi:hypothetical protein
MLLYNVCYLAHTQAVEIPLSQAGDVLSNLWAVCCSADLGRSAHPLLVITHKSMLTLINAGALTKLTRYSRHPHLPASHSTLDNYSKPPLRRDRAPYARGQLGHTRIGIPYSKRTSGTYWTMLEQVLLNSPKP